ncbi:hypothetical protein SUDANB121_03009 [Nocardiopsis dassonvillei]|uniref:hypothetical protein n=1 Tax=Nocardiopsis dassonvillei TaxID=2014 RepID=UPI003F54BD73
MIAVLLPPALGRPTRLPDLGDALPAAGLSPVRVAVAGDELPPHAARYVAAASLEIRRLVPADAPTALVVEGDAGPLAGALGAAQRAAHRPVFGYVLVDALLPQPGTATRTDLERAQNPPGAPLPLPPAGEPEGYRTETLPPSGDWPDAPCGYLLTDPARAHAARLARMRGWQVRECAPREASAALAGLLLDLRGTA